MLDSDIKDYTEPKYLFHSYGTENSSIQLYVKEGSIYCVVEWKEKLWMVSLKDKYFLTSNLKPGANESNIFIQHLFLMLDENSVLDEV